MNTTTTTAEAFHVYWTNFQYFAHENPHATIDAALQYGRSKCFDFQVFRAATDANPYREPGAFELVAAWSVIGGTRYYRKSADEAAELDGGATLHAPQTVSQPCGALSKLYGVLVALSITTSACGADVTISDATGRVIGTPIDRQGHALVVPIQTEGRTVLVGVMRNRFIGLAGLGFTLPKCTGETRMQAKPEDVIPAAAVELNSWVVWVAGDEPEREYAIRSVLSGDGKCQDFDPAMLVRGTRAEPVGTLSQEYQPPFEAR